MSLSLPFYLSLWTLFLFFSYRFVLMIVCSFSLFLSLNLLFLCLISFSIYLFLYRLFCLPLSVLDTLLYYLTPIIKYSV
jgi:hypothetical protein